MHQNQELGGDTRPQSHVDQAEGAMGHFMLCPGTKAGRIWISIAPSEFSSIWCHRSHAVSSRSLTLTNKIIDLLSAIKAYGKLFLIVSFVWKLVLQKWQLEDVQAQ